jgi:zinc/manganese transport system ATP-binding protein/zinc transport system ATP-binding protein
MAKSWWFTPSEVKMLHPTPHRSSSQKSIVVFDNVTCGYAGQAILSDIDLTINDGDFVGLLGPSGSGKTTLLRAILGAVDLYNGGVFVDGVSISDRRANVGYVPQLEAIDWNFPVTVEEAVLMGSTMDRPLFPWFRRADRELAHEIMDRLGIISVSKRHIRELSGGQQQRVFLARALVGSPKVLLLDEPTAGVDIKTRDDVMHLLHDLNHQGVTILMTTHEINAVAAHLPSVICINGKVVAEGPPSEVFTTETLAVTYGAEMPVIHYQGLSLVAESPHLYGRNGSDTRTAHVHASDGLNNA